MTALAVDYHADRLLIASDSLVYNGGELVGRLDKVHPLPHIRAVVTGRGVAQLIVAATAELLLDPSVQSIEAAADALPSILRRLRTDMAIPATEQGGQVAHVFLAGWSEAEQRMRWFIFLANEDFEPQMTGDLAYGGPTSIPTVLPAYRPLDRVSIPIEARLLTIMREIDRFCVDYPEDAAQTRTGGEILLTEVTEAGVSQRFIGTIDVDEKVIN